MAKSENIESEVGAAIRQVRIRRGYTLDDVAARANLSSTAVRALELGRGSTLRTLIKVLSVLNEEEFLTDWTDSKYEFSPIAKFRENQKMEAQPKRVSRKRINRT
jgi:transcriptional regulator with XRE-family HTH domain